MVNESEEEQRSVAPEEEVPQGDGRSLAEEEGVMPTDEEVVEAPVEPADDILEYDVTLPEDILEYDISLPTIVPAEEVPQADDKLAYDVTLPQDILEYDISLAAPAIKGYAIEPPPAPLSPALKEPPKLFYQPPGFFRSQRRLNT